MRNSIFTCLVFLSSAVSWGQSKYSITLDLNNISNDRIKVTIIPPKISDKEIHYIMPTYIPGSYYKKDFGRFVSDMYVVTKSGYSPDIKKEGENTFVIKNKSEEEITKIEYYISDSWDMEKPSSRMSDAEFNYVFQPGGTNISAGQNVIINHYGYFGYIDGFKDVPYEITILKPGAMYATTTLSRKKGSASKDYFFADNYSKLVDNPIMYCLPDTAGFTIDSTHILVSVYSENGVVKAKNMAYYLHALSRSMYKFLGRLPVKQYAFIMYFASPSNSALTKYGGYGAMEHNNCSFYFLPEIANEDSLATIVRQFVPHNFMHILTPLNIHSDKYAEFDFKHIPASRHLWLYEGVTEYMANLIQVRDSLMTQDQFMEVMHEKMDLSASFPDVPMLDMSMNLNKKINREAYMNIFDKGAVFAFMLDVKLNELSKGTKNLKDLLLSLSKEYGPEKTFKDDELFDEIVRLTYPEIRGFLNDYLEKNKPLPYKEYFDKIGMNYYPAKSDTTWTFGKFSLTVDQINKLFMVLRADPSNLFGLQTGDYLTAVNGKTMELYNFEETIAPIYAAVSGAKVSIQYTRGMDLRNAEALPKAVTENKTNVVTSNESATPEQKRLREQVLSSGPSK
jgi:predicted metalloprotease with PDZ domain